MREIFVFQFGVITAGVFVAPRTAGVLDVFCEVLLRNVLIAATTGAGVLVDGCIGETGEDANTPICGIGCSSREVWSSDGVFTGESVGTTAITGGVPDPLEGGSVVYATGGVDES